MNAVRKAFKALLPVAVIALGVLLARRLMMRPPEPERKPAAERVTLVEVVEATASEGSPTIEAMGLVVPARQVVLQPEVSGRVVAVHPELVPGGRLPAGAVALRIDDADYRLNLNQQKARVRQASLKLKVEQGRRAIARREWKLLEPELKTDPRGGDLAQREPYVAAAEADLQAARSAVRQARLQIERTRLIVPFDALVIEEQAEVGQMLSPQSRIATLVGTAAFWVRVSLPVEQVARLRVPSAAEGSGQGSAARIVHRLAGGKTVVREGRVVRLLGDLDPAGRMARLIVKLQDPLGTGPGVAPGGGEGGLPIFLGSFVRVEIEAEPIPGTVKIPRAALHDGGTVWVVGQGDRLEIRAVQIAWRSADSLLLSSGVRPGERLVVSPLSAPVEGMRLRLAGETGSDEARGGGASGASSASAAVPPVPARVADPPRTAGE